MFCSPNVLHNSHLAPSNFVIDTVNPNLLKSSLSPQRLAFLVMVDQTVLGHSFSFCFLDEISIDRRQYLALRRKGFVVYQCYLYVSFNCIWDYGNFLILKLSLNCPVEPIKPLTGLLFVMLQIWMGWKINLNFEIQSNCPVGLVIHQTLVIFTKSLWFVV